MNESQRHERLSDLFHKARGLEESERAELLSAECPDDLDLRQEVEELVRESERRGPLGDGDNVGQRLGAEDREGLGGLLSDLPGLGVKEGDTLGDFRLLSLLGAGGMGQVWEAEQLSLSRPVALKLVPPERVSEKTLAYFEREARAGGRLAHPGIVAVHGWGEAAGVHWIAQELVPGGRTLQDFVAEARQRKDFDSGYYSEVAVLTAKVADALQAAHAAGVLHRDVKPSNVLLTTEGEPKLADFGLARMSEDVEVSVSGEVLGTYSYMSPEQVEGKRSAIDLRTDIFSLGVVLYELIALQRPFQGDATHQILSKILHEEPRPLSELRSRVPRDLAVICSKALEKEPRRRYASMAELAADLRRFLSSEPIAAKPPGPFRRMQLWALRNPTQSVAGVLAGAALVIATLLLLQLSTTSRVEAAGDSGLAYSLGQWDLCLGLIERARGVDAATDAELGLREARCLLALHKHGDARVLLEEMSSRSLPEEVKGPVELLLGWLELGEWVVFGAGRGLEDPLDRVRRAQGLPLNDCDALVAQALLEPNSADALASYEAAVGADPRDYIANISRLQLSSCSGRFEVAQAATNACRALYPVDPTSDAMAYLLVRSRGEAPSQDLEERLRNSLGPDLDSALVAVAGYLANIRVAMTDEVSVSQMSTGGAQWLVTAWEQSGAGVRETLRHFIDDGSSSSAGCLTPAVHHLGAAFDFALVAGEAATDGEADLPAALAALEGALERHADGFLHTASVFLKWALSTAHVEGSVDAAQELEAITLPVLQRGGAPSLFPEYTEHSLAFEVAIIGVISGAADSEVAEFAKERAEAIAAWLTLRPMSDPEIFAGILTQAPLFKNTNAQLAVARAWAKQGDAGLDAERGVVKALIRNRQWAEALESCDRLLEQYPEAEGLEAMRKKALEAATQWLTSTQEADGASGPR